MLHSNLLRLALPLTALGTGSLAFASLQTGPATVVRAGGAAMAGSPGGICAATLEDQAGGPCIEASTVPTFGSLYPLSNDFFIDASTGNIGIGTTAPARAVDIFSNTFAPVRVQGNFNPGYRLNNTSQASDWTLIHDQSNNFAIRDSSIATTRVVVDGMNGRMGIGTGSPEGGLTVVTPKLTAPVAPGVHLGPDVGATGNTGIEIVAEEGRRAYIDFKGGNPTSTFECRLVYDDVDNNLEVLGASALSVPVLEIRGGADIVEGFDTTNDEVLEPGTVVVIDPETPGALMRATTPYDFKVAGVVSGAGGVQPGLHLGQEHVLDGDTKVAMTGRVYVKCSIENGAIRPGDRLTTAALAGHAMKATDSARSDGAVIGKAMSSLDSGTGLVLVLVNLQ